MIQVREPVSDPAQKCAFEHQDQQLLVHLVFWLCPLLEGSAVGAQCLCDFLVTLHCITGKILSSAAAAAAGFVITWLLLCS